VGLVCAAGEAVEEACVEGDACPLGLGEWLATIVGAFPPQAAADAASAKSSTADFMGAET